MRRLPLALTVLCLASSCRPTTAPTLPDPFSPISASTDAPGSQIAQTYDPIALGQVPELLGVTTEVRDGQWILRAYLRPRDPNPYYSGEQPGGWRLQVFLNTDQNAATGYSGHGFDYVLTDEEAGLSILGAAGFDFGPMAGYAGLNLSVPDRLTITVPLSAIQDDGALNWRVQTYSDGTLADTYDGSTIVGQAAILIRGSSRRSKPGRF